MTQQTLSEAIALREAVVADFHRICDEGRESPAPMDEFVKNRIAYLQACEDVYTALWYSVVDSGVQVLRPSKIVQDIDSRPAKKA
jgi:hypothetical protein